MLPDQLFRRGEPWDSIGLDDTVSQAADHEDVKHMYNYITFPLPLPDAMFPLQHVGLGEKDASRS